MTEAMTEAKLAEDYNRTQDTSDFDEGEEGLVTVRRNVTISVRFSDTEIAELRDRAEQAGVKVTSFIRAAALEATSPVDRAALGGLVRDLERRAHAVAAMIGGGARDSDASHGAATGLGHSLARRRSRRGTT